MILILLLNNNVSDYYYLDTTMLKGEVLSKVLSPPNWPHDT